MLRAAIMLLAALPIAAAAQTAPNQHGPNVTREQFVQRASEMAGRRFDTIDTNHSGVVTRDQIRAYRQAHGGMGGQSRQ